MLYCAHGIPLERDARSGPLNLPEGPLWPTGDAPADEFCSEDERLAVLASFDAEALAGDEELARITRFAAHLCRAESAAVSLVDDVRQRFIAGENLSSSETPRSTSFCAHAMLGSEILEVLDATNDPRFADFALVTGEAHLRSYVGAPLISSEGAPLGALCVYDTKPHDTPLSDLQREGLLVLADAVKRRLEAHRDANSADTELRNSAARLRSLIDSVPDIAWSTGPGGRFDMFNARFEEVTGVAPPQRIKDWKAVIHPDDFDRTVSRFYEMAEASENFEDEYRLRQADGSYRWVLSRAVKAGNDLKTARWFGTLTDIDDKRRSSDERELLAGELAHRIKNIFAVISGLITLHARGDETLKVFADTLTQNIRALSRAQEFALKVNGDTEDDLKDLLEVLMAPYGVPGQSAVSIGGDAVPTGARSATPLALVFHELATNSAKYGALSVEAGRVEISVTKAGDDVRIDWRESGGPPAEQPETEGFGSRLVTMAIEHQLNGSLAQDWGDAGLTTQITVPADRLAQ